MRGLLLNRDAGGFDQLSEALALDPAEVVQLLAAAGDDLDAEHLQLLAERGLARCLDDLRARLVEDRPGRPLGRYDAVPAEVHEARQRVRDRRDVRQPRRALL